MKRSLIAAAVLATLASAPAAEARRGGGYAEGMIFLAETTEVDASGAALSLCILEKTRKVMFLPLFRSAEAYVMAPNRCIADSYYSVDGEQFTLGQSLGVFPQELPGEPALTTGQTVSGMWGWGLVVPLAAFLFASQMRGRAKPALDSFADKAVTVMAYIARADGEIAQAEIDVMCNVLHQLTEQQYDPGEVAQYALSLSGELSDRDIKKLGKGLSDGHKEVLVQAAIMVASADGNMDGTENHLIYRLSKALKVGGEKVDDMIVSSTGAAPVPAE